MLNIPNSAYLEPGTGNPPFSHSFFRLKTLQISFGFRSSLSETRVYY